MDEINNMLIALEKDKKIVHALLITETWLLEGEKKMFEIKGFSSFHCTRFNDRKGGGVACMITT